MKYYFPIYLDAGNRGCEAIAKGTAILLNEKNNRLVGYCRDVELDKRLGMAEYMTLIPCRRESLLVDKFLGALNRIIRTGRVAAWRQLYPFRVFLRLITKDDIMVSTGGDMMCYDNNGAVFSNIWLHERGIRTVLWGCSMGPENQTKEKLKSLHNYSLIYTRESLTYEYFRSLGLANVYLFPDPAFILEAHSFPLPKSLLNNNVLGLNISNYVMGGMSLNGNFAQEVLTFIDHILRNTTLRILLIPHVTWNRDGENQDDREMARIISTHFNKPERIGILDIDALNYCQIRYAISKCRMFIGARTHAVISAYSMCVPTIALGYSIKSRGIAKDLGLDERLVVDSKNCSPGTLLRSYSYLVENEDAIREHLKCVMPAYKQKTYQIRDILRDI